MVQEKFEQIDVFKEVEEKQEKTVSEAETKQAVETPREQIPQFCMVEISKIKVKERFRDLKKVDYLMESIKNNGQISPIQITKDYVLVFGNHRLEACKRLNLKEIKAEIVDISEDKAKLNEIEENLVRTELTTLEKCLHVAEHYKLYKKLNYITNDENSEKRNDCVFDKNVKVLSGSEIIAQSSGYSLRSVQNFKKVGMALTKEAIAKIKGTAIEDNITALLDIAKVKIAEQQLQIIEEKLNPKPKAIKNDKIFEQGKTETSNNEKHSVSLVSTETNFQEPIPKVDEQTGKNINEGNQSSTVKENPETEQIVQAQTKDENPDTIVAENKTDEQQNSTELPLGYKVDFLRKKVVINDKWYDLPEAYDMDNSSYNTMVTEAKKMHGLPL